MSRFKRILVPIDFSEQSVKYASSLAKDTKAEVIVLHVLKKSAHLDYQPSALPLLEGWPSLFEDPPRLPVDILLRESALDLSNFLASNLPKTPHVKITKILRLGKPIKEIATAAREEKIDLVVLGLRKRFLFSHLVSGQPFKVITRLPCPVLLAPPMTDDVHEPRFGPYEPVGDAWIESDSLIALDNRV